MQILLTKRAENQFDNIIESIKTNWGNDSVNHFIKKVDNIFILLKSFPTIGQLEINDIRGFQLTNQTKILYRIKEENIIILAFFDVRQNPNNKNNFIKS